MRTYKTLIIAGKQLPDHFFYQRFYTFVQLRSRYISKLIILRLVLKFSVGCNTDFFSFHNPVSPLDPTCHLHMLCIYIDKCHWSSGETYLKNKLNDTNIMFY